MGKQREVSKKLGAFELKQLEEIKVIHIVFEETYSKSYSRRIPGETSVETSLKFNTQF